MLHETWLHFRDVDFEFMFFTLKREFLNHVELFWYMDSIDS